MIVADRMGWLGRAACAGLDPDLFHPARGTATDEGKAVCATCPVRVECLAWALDSRQDQGIWGGLSARERAQLPNGPRRCPRCGGNLAAGACRQQRYCTSGCRDLHRTVAKNVPPA